MIKAILELMMEMAREKQRKGHIKDFVTALYSVKMDVTMEIGKRMDEIRKKEAEENERKSK